MKKFFVTILALVYLSSTIGATINMHYCMDKLVAWGLGDGKTKSKGCPNCGMAKTSQDKLCDKESKGCCKDEQEIVKLENDQKISEASFQFSQILSEANTPIFFDYSIEYVSSLTEKYPFTHGPPRLGATPIYILNCNFRI